MPAAGPDGVALGPEGDAFYRPPDPLPGRQPGDLIWASRLADTPAGTIGWRVLYRSVDVHGSPVAVSGLVWAPATPSHADVVLSWAHATTGIGDRCAPSRQVGSGLFVDKLIAPLVAGRGWTLAATDYEGLGTPGIHPYLVGQSSGRGVLDIVRAARQLPAAALDADAQVVILGHSQGGQAALMANEMASSYAPELHLVGTVAAAPGTELSATISGWAANVTIAPHPGYGLMGLAGFLAAYPQLPVAAAADAYTARLLGQVVETCIDDADVLASSITVPQPDPSTDPTWKAMLDASSPGAVAPSSPVFIAHGDADIVASPAGSAAVHDAYCRLGATVQRTVYPGATHVTVLTAAGADMLTWLIDRVAGRPARTDCAAS